MHYQNAWQRPKIKFLSGLLMFLAIRTIPETNQIEIKKKQPKEFVVNSLYWKGINTYLMGLTIPQFWKDITISSKPDISFGIRFQSSVFLYTLQEENLLDCLGLDLFLRCTKSPGSYMLHTGLIISRNTTERTICG